MQKKDLKIIFMGTPDFAVETLRALVDNDYNVVAVVTQPDKPVGRHGSILQPSAVKQYALEHQLPVLQPEKMKDPEFVRQLQNYNANLQVVVAFRMLPEIVWSMPEYGTFNVHAALLPQYRGAAPINWAVINGETQTGVTTFFLDHHIDTGRIIMQRPFPIPDDADVEYVYDGLMHLGADVCLQTLEKIIAADGHPESIAQADFQNITSENNIPHQDLTFAKNINHQDLTFANNINHQDLTFANNINHQDLPFEKNINSLNTQQTLKSAPKIFKETCQINWNKTAKQNYDFIRGLSPYPGAWTTLRTTDGKETVLKIFKTSKTTLPNSTAVGNIIIINKNLYIACSDFLLQIHELQLAGKKRMDALSFLNGMKGLNEAKIIW